MPQACPVSDQPTPELRRAALRLITARSEEAGLSIKCCRHPDDELLYLQWARARQQIEELQQEYIGCLDRCDFPDIALRDVVEGEH
jgi:hypothetical protein